MDFVIEPINLFNLVVIPKRFWAISGEPAQLRWVEEGSNSNSVGGVRVPLGSHVQHRLCEVLVSVQDVLSGIPMEQVSITSDYDHIKWFVVVVQLIVQSEGMVEFRQGGVSNGDIIYMLCVSHILGPHVARWGKELVKG